MKNNKDLHYIMVLGYGWSGSGAVVDLLREFDGFWGLNNTEFRMLRDPYGVMSLEEKLIEHWDPLVYDMSIRDFLWYAETLNRTPSKLSKEGGCYNTIFGPQYMEATHNFVNKITKFRYDCYWSFFDFQLSSLQNIIRKVKRKINKQKYESSLNKRMYFSDLTKDEFYQYVKEYVNEIFEPIAEKANATHILMDQAIPVQLPYKSKDYFQNAKTIIVDRDPRDIYFELVRDEKIIGKEVKHTQDAMKYVEWHKAYRRNIEEYKKDRDILFLQFEDIIENYEDNVEKIKDFLGGDKIVHLEEKKRTLFIPEKSAKNVGLWRKYANQNEMDVLYQELQEYCYQGK